MFMPNGVRKTGTISGPARCSATDHGTGSCCGPNPCFCGDDAAMAQRLFLPHTDQPAGQRCLTVGKGIARPQMEGDAGIIGGDIPGFRKTGFGLAAGPAMDRRIEDDVPNGENTVIALQVQIAAGPGAWAQPGPLVGWTSLRDMRRRSWYSRRPASCGSSVFCRRSWCVAARRGQSPEGPFAR